MGALKRLIVIALALCATTCTRRDTGRANVWRRTVEPRLTGAAWQPCRVSLAPDRAVPDSHCPTPTAVPSECEEAQASASQAARLLAMQHDCTDTAIAALE